MNDLITIETVYGLIQIVPARAYAEESHAAETQTETHASAETEHGTTAAEAESDGIAAGAAALGLDGKLLIAQIINFLILLYLLRRFLYGPLVGLLVKRRETIEDSLKKAEEIEKRSAEFAVEHEERINKSKKEAAEMITDAKKATEAMRQETIAATTAEAEKMLKRAEQEITRQKETMLAELKHEIGALVVAATVKVIGKEAAGQLSDKSIQEAVAEVKQ